MESYSEKWRNSIKTLEVIIKDLYGHDVDDLDKYNQIEEILYEYDISNLTLRDMSDFLKRQLKLKERPTIEEIIKYIMDENNKEELVRLGLAKNPIDTRENDKRQERDEISNQGEGIELRS